MALVIDWKTDIIALSTFIISICVNVYFLIGHALGPNIQMTPPTQIMLHAYSYGDSEKYLRISAGLSYYNTGQAGNNALLLKEKLFFAIGNNKLFHEWQTFEEFSSDGIKLTSSSSKPALPSVIDAGSGLVHETYFAPVSTKCSGDVDCVEGHNFVRLDDFANDFFNKNNDRPDLIVKYKFKFEAEIYQEKSISTNCSTYITLKDISQLMDKERNWVTLKCLEENQ